jgi:tRNA threonylcarbamoyladenosine biosynthesis protein TsaE
MSETVSLKDLRSTRALARRVAKTLSGRAVLLLSGDLGAGKTTFVRYLAGFLGIDPSWVSSPSFTLIQPYPAGGAGYGLVHVDLYRLKGIEDLEALGLEELWASGDLIVVEWPQLLEEAGIPTGRSIHRIAFQVSPDGSRTAHWAEPSPGSFS